MTHKIRYILFLLILTNFFTEVCAQNLSKTQKRKILLEVVTTMEDYKRYAAIDQDTHSQDNFLDLFTDLNAPVFNDLVGLSRENTLTARQYADLLHEKSNTTRIVIKNIKCDEITRQGDRWIVNCTFEKSVNLTDECKVEYSSDFLNEKKDYVLRATLVYQDEAERCAIEKIECPTPPQNPLPEIYRVIRHRSKYDDDVNANGKPLRFNAMNQAFVATDARISYKDPEVIIKLIEDSASCNLWHIKYKTQNLRLRVHYDMTLGDYYSIDRVDGMTMKNSGSEFGADFGYTFPSKSKVKFSLNAGFLIANSKIDMSLPTSSYSYNDDGSGDIDGDAYTRYYNNVKASETVSMTHLGSPLYADLDFCFSRFLTIYIQAGVKPYLKMSAKLKDYSVTAESIYGIYPQYDNLHLDGTWGENGFGENKDLTNGKTASNVRAKSFSMDLFGGAGFRIKPIRSTPLALEIGLQYQTGILDMWDANAESFVYSGTAASSTTAISHYSKTEGEQCKMLNDGLSKVKRQHINLNIGLIYKF